MTNILMKGSALGALAAALGLSASPAAAAPAVDFAAPMVAIDTGLSAQSAELAQDRESLAEQFMPTRPAKAKVALACIREIEGFGDLPGI